MNSFLNQIISLVVIMSIVFTPSISWAGDIVTAGTELTVDSYVFTIEEATNLLNRVEELEAKEKELERYIELEALRVQQIGLYKLNLDYSQSQVDRYAHLNVINQDLIDRYNKRDRLQTWENIGFLALGMALTVGAFVAADAITDQMEVSTGISTSF
jgi:hypothetical protein